MTGAAARRTIDDLVREFGRRFWFGSTTIRDHLALLALRRDMSEPGVSVVITPDPAEMYGALRRDREDSRAPALPPGGGPGPDTGVVPPG